MMNLLFRGSLPAVLAAVALAAPARAQTSQETPDNPTAYAALREISKSLGREALDRVVEVTGRDGAPQPALWKIVLKEGPGSREIDVQDGRIIAQRPLSRPPAYPAPINFPDLQLDSSGAFDATDAQARKVKLRFDSLNYVLRTSESSGKPVWRIELINKEGTGVGTIRVAAHDGTIISKEGRLASNVPTVVSTPPPPPRTVVSTPSPPRVVVSTPYPVSTPRTVTSTTTTTTYTRTPPASRDSDNVYVQAPPVQQSPPPPPEEEEGGLFTRAGRTLDKTNHRVEGTLRRAGAKVQRFFTGHSDIDRDVQPESERPGNQPD